MKDQSLGWRNGLLCEELEELSLIASTYIKLEGENRLHRVVL